MPSVHLSAGSAAAAPTMTLLIHDVVEGAGVGTAFLLNEVDIAAAKRSLWLPPDMNVTTLEFFPRLKNLFRIDDVSDPRQVACVSLWREAS